MRRLAAALGLAVLASSAAAQPGSGWLPARVAELQALDKVTARISVIEAPVDQPVSFGTLVIRVGACHRRPPDDPPDAAAWLEIRDTRPGAAEVPFRGWMFAASPGLSMLEHAVYDIRVLACR
ncbi:MAG: DUF2155 domain-containing protein [Acetobacteraceae bacterium]|jgi:hypothetical protein|nr:DUF2155 domain-containing protein [Acetobacteraceae bacterium]